jgi:hypothetical protein
MADLFIVELLTDRNIFKQCPNSQTLLYTITEKMIAGKALFNIFVRYKSEGYLVAFCLQNNDAYLGFSGVG